MDGPTYLDYNATTPIDPRVKEAMLPYIDDHFGNPSSGYAYGTIARKAVDRARRQVAELLGADPGEIVFTGGGSESNNCAIKGVALAHKERGRHIITSRVEHPAVLNICRYLEEHHGFEVTYLPVDDHGRVSVTSVDQALRSDTILITIMHANNEVGTVQPIPELGSLAHERGVLFHTDAAQSVGKIRTHVRELGVDLLTLAGHKLYAPKGIGVLYVRRRTHLHPLIHGGGQENGQRAGTENVPYIVALGEACELAEKSLGSEIQRLKSLRDRLENLLTEGLALHHLPGPTLNGHPDERLPNTLNVSFPGLIAQRLLDHVQGVAASTGSACHAGSEEPSPVLTAMGVDRKRALGAVRLSLGRFTTEIEINQAAQMLLLGLDELWNKSAGIK